MAKSIAAVALASPAFHLQQMLAPLVGLAGAILSLVLVGVALSSLSALLVPLHDPIRVAEDLAVLDLASGGRMTTIAGLGYRPESRDPDPG